MIKSNSSKIILTLKNLSKIGLGLIFFSTLIQLCIIPLYASDTTISSSDTIILRDFTGNEYVYHEGFGNSNQTVITNSDWGYDEITVTGSPGSRTVLDQFVKATGSQTKISRNALFIGSGSIASESIYKGSNTSNGEDGQTGVLVTGNNYGVLIENGSLIFNDSFGGIEKSIATASGNYLIQQIGNLGIYIPPGSFLIGETSTTLKLMGRNSGTLESRLYGSFPQNGTDFFSATTKGWTNGTGRFSFEGNSDSNGVEVIFELLEGWGDFSTQVLMEHLEVNSQIEFEGFMIINNG